MSQDESDHLKSNLRTWNALSFGFGIPGLVLQLGAAALAKSFSDEPGDHEGVVLLLRIVGSGLLIAGLAFNAKYKGLHWAWCFLGLLSIIGLFILYFLPKVCQGCRKSQAYRRTQCVSCGAPL